MKKIILLLCVTTLLTTVSCASKTEPTNNITNEPEKIEETIEIVENITTETAEKTDTSTNNSDNTPTVKPIGGSSGGCQIHDHLYHSYSDKLINYIGEEKFYEWNESTKIEGETGCIPNRNFYSCIEYFDIPNEVIIEVYKDNYFDSINWNIKALLARDKEAFEYSARLENIDYEYSEKMTSEMMLKLNLLYCMRDKKDEKTIEYYSKVTEKGTYYPICTISIYEMISNSSITREEFLDSLAFATAKGEELWANPRFEYNLDLLFGDQSAMEEAIKNLEIPEYESRVKMIDALLHIEEK